MAYLPLKRNIKLRQDQLRKEHEKDKSSDRPIIAKPKIINLKKTNKYVASPVQVNLEKQAMQKIRYNMTFLLPAKYKGVEGTFFRKSKKLK